MADDFDVEAMLEAPYKKEDISSKSSGDKDEERKKKRKKHSRSRSRSRDKRSRSRDKDRRRSRSRDRRSKSRERKRKSRSRSRGRYRDRFRRSRSRSPIRGGRYRQNFGGQPRQQTKPAEQPRARSPKKKSKSKSPLRENGVTKDESGPQLSPEERDQRTVFVMQLSQRVRPKDLEDFFSSVGKVRDVRLVSDHKSRRSKGFGYVEFGDKSSVPLAIGLTNQKLLGVPIIVQASQAEKNRAAANSQNLQKGSSGPMRLYVGSLHFNITEDMLRGIFEPFGKIDNIQLMKDSETGRSKGYGFITFHDAECAKKALEQLNGFELAGRPMKVGHVTERSDAGAATSFLDSDELERTGIELSTTGRLQLMAKLAEGTGFEMPAAAQSALNMPMASLTGLPTLPGAGGPGVAAPAGVMPAAGQQPPPPPVPIPAYATPCFQLSNMFDIKMENSQNWDLEIRNDVVEECTKHGGVLHVFVDKNSDNTADPLQGGEQSQGNVYVKCPNIQTAAACVNALHGRWFAGKMIQANYVPIVNYHALFPEAITATTLLQPASAQQ
ncbi:RNA-binding protein 39-like isoform X1 [Branchiostoma lanceolatum]|uniref:RNA-binding protein 39-like isoform X1 n=1 Tax=Branchiostoma lanceolatum TaxID=7740 RepID=UPI003452C968